MKKNFIYPAKLHLFNIALAKLKRSGTLLIILFMSAQLLPAQQLPTPSKWNFGLGAGTVSSKLKNENIKADETLNTESKHHPFIEINILRRLDNNFYFSAGISYLEYSTLSDCSGIFISSALKTDTDGYDYHPFYDADFKIERKITTLSVPLGIKVLSGQPGKTRLQLETGIQSSFVISSAFKQEGHFERKGLYNDPLYTNVHILLEDIPRLNYGNNSMNKDTSLSAKSILLNWYISAGISAPVSARTDIYFKGYLTIGLGDITPREYQKAYTDLMGRSNDYKKTTLFAAGIVAGILLR